MKHIIIFCGILACSSDSVDLEDKTIPIDTDGDGFSVEEDCNDNDASTFPGATEICDGIDNNCDSEIDENTRSTFYADSDGDGFGNEAITISACDASDGFVANGNDCDDGMENVYPGSTEICDGIDNNCDGNIDEDLGMTFYTDSDGDGFGDENQPIVACELSLGTSTLTGDCDDGDPTISPMSEESCDGIDNNCDGNIDEGVTTTYFRDFDEDGFGDEETTISSCDSQVGYISRGGDCDDTESLAHPSAIEICDGIDNDCDQQTDEDGAAGEITYYQDADEDGFGNPSISHSSCEQPAGYSTDLSDCDDDNASIHPGANEYCNSLDDDCDGDIDEDSALDVEIWYADSDTDGYGSAGASQYACQQPSGFVADSTDCNDGSASAHPNATEICDEIDNNCDGTIDEGVKTTYYTDIDGDGHGSTLSIESCSQPSGFVLQSGDCDDEDAARSPSETEICDDLDNDCDGVIDNGLLSLWYLDADLDGFGDVNETIESCSQPVGYIEDDTDCDDTSPLAYVGATEDCDGIDNDCNGVIDDGLRGIAEACPAESCQAIYDQDPSSADGTYWLDLTGIPNEYNCDMTTDGGGWTQIVNWDRESRGDGQSALFSQMTQVFDNMTTVSTTSNSVTWCDQNSDADVMAYRIDVPFLNRGESILDVYSAGDSMDDSAMFFYYETTTATEDVLCRQHIHGGYDQTELSYVPYSCSLTANTSWTWNDTYENTFSDSITSFQMRSFHWDGNFGDRSSLYRLNVWIR
ncbi:MAG: MopE-related protein [Myxococcota bacterium]|nr:MopE-related protein [Myxococcota bacterium]